MGNINNSTECIFLLFLTVLDEVISVGLEDSYTRRGNSAVLRYEYNPGGLPDFVNQFMAS